MNAPQGRLLVLAAIATCLLLAGCAATRERGSRLLGTPDEGGLLIVDCRLKPVYDSAVFEEGFAKDLQTGVFNMPGQDALDEVAIERRDRPGRFYFGTAFADVMIFSRLEPGPYILRSMAHGRHIIDHIKDVNYYLARREFPFGGATGNIITFDIKRGGLSYVGGIDVSARYELRENPTQPGEVDFIAADDPSIDAVGNATGGVWQAVVDYQPARERNAWVKLLQRSDGTVWADSILGRIEALNSGYWFGPPE